MAQVPQQVRCLQEWEGYGPFQRRAAFLKRYWAVLAIAPFFVVMVVLFQYFSTTTSTLLLAVVVAAIVWAIAVGGYTALLFWRGVVCPKCGSRFGRDAQCSSCGLPRTLPAQSKVK